MEALRTDVAIIGGGLGACAAALAAARLGYRVLLTEETHWIGGQLTNQAVPPDEHRWIEDFGATASYRALRRGIRDYYRAHLPLTAEARAREALNPGNGWVSRLCHDPRVAVAVLHQMMIPHQLSGRLVVMLPHRPIAAWTHGDRITGIVVRGIESGRDVLIEAPFFIDATPYGDLLDLASVEHVLGAESRAETGEPHAAERADPKAQQAITVCFAMEHLPGEDRTIDRPRQYALWRDLRPPGWPGPLLSWTTMRPETHEPLTRFLFEAEDGHPWWPFRRILDRTNFEEGFARSDITVVNWPQNDYWFGPIVGVEPAERAHNLDAARQLSLSLLYWLQTEAPRPDGGVGYPGLQLRGDVVGGTPDGLAPAPYVRESRRLRAELTVLEQHIAYPLRPDGPELFEDSVGIGSYRIDLHPRVGGAGYLDTGCWPFQIPLGAMIPVRVENLLPGGKNLGVTHITNGAYRLHPVEWTVGEVAGALAAFCLERKLTPRAVRNRRASLEAFQSLLRREGVELSWPSLAPV
ncbi:FAD-dependent oxidoreductase [Sorangium sp. So ce1036]|uniref:FAD-dependent oxidoreductase n=1 Tax=Sorangium sp. So ce1036 TaxID=3133328 RepID=UPI003F05E6A7